MITTYNKLGFLHSYNDQPSLIDDLGNRFWHINGKLERQGDLPCIEFINGDKRYNLDNGCFKIVRKYSKKYFNLKNQLHRLNDPAIIEYYENDNIQSEYYYLNGKLNKLNSPAVIWYFQDGNIESEGYYIDGKPSRLDGPAIIEYYENGNIQCEVYYVNGKQSRLDGPAGISYYENGNIVSESYYINDKQLTEQQFLKLSTSLQSNIIP